MQKLIKIDPNDNVLVALQDLPAGEVITFGEKQLILPTSVKAKHKIAERDLNTEDLITMYGVTVGKPVSPIMAGEVITTANTTHATSKFDYTGNKPKWHTPDVAGWQNITFNGYHRKDGRVGTANFWLVVPLVFCENRNIEVLQDILESRLGYGKRTEYQIDLDKLIHAHQAGKPVEEIAKLDILKEETVAKDRVFPNVDGIKFLTHQTGCGGNREDAQMLCRLLAGYITHPNVAGATVLSLGCQNAQIDLLKAAIDDINPEFDKPLVILEQQQSESEKSFIAEAVTKTFAGLVEANRSERKPAPISKLVLGLECGGSDGFSGISANPSLGHTSDLLVALGASAILAEFPELNGVEQELINRCSSAESARKFMELMRAYGARAKADGSGFEANPSPGNIRDGLITDAMKSAGAAKKGGTSPVVDVLDYGQPLMQNGLNLLCTPGNDVESTTALAGSGANIMVFTTGLGTPTGNPIVPVIKMSSNDRLFDNMGDIIDINAGDVISGSKTIEEKGAELLNLIIAVANGEYEVKAMKLGQDDFIPWKRGISL